MYLRKTITTSTEDYWERIEQLGRQLETADAILIGAGAGLSASAGADYSGKRFTDNFADFIQQYHFRDMYSGGFGPFESLEEYWAYWSRYIYINRYGWPVDDTHRALLALMKDKNYFVLSTNVDHRFQSAGFDKQRLFYTQGDFGLWQCSKPCHQKTYDNEDAVRLMMARQKNRRIPTQLIPRCPKCGELMSNHLRSDNTFVQDKGWYAAARRYKDFIHQYKDGTILFLELGVGYHTPGIIKYPFWQMTAENPNAVYACLNLREAFVPDEIREQSICINGDIGEIIRNLS